MDPSFPIGILGSVTSRGWELGGIRGSHPPGAAQGFPAAFESLRTAAPDPQGSGRAKAEDKLLYPRNAEVFLFPWDIWDGTCPILKSPEHHSPCCPSRRRGPWWSSIPPGVSRRSHRAWQGQRQGGWDASVPAQTGTWSRKMSGHVRFYYGRCSEWDGGCFWHLCAAPGAAWWHKFT